MSKVSRNVQSMNMRVKGFYGTKARWWLNAVQYSKDHDDYSDAEKEWAYSNGFLPDIVERYNINDGNKSRFISIYDYCYLFPINDIFRKWIKDRVTVRHVLKPYKEYLPEQYYHFYIRDNSLMIVKLLDCPENATDSIDGVLDFIKSKGKLAYRRTTGIAADVIEYADGSFVLNGETLTEEALTEYIEKTARTNIRVLTEFVNPRKCFAAQEKESKAVLRLFFYNKYADNPRIGQAYLRVDKDDETVVIDEMSERIGDNIKEYSSGSTDQMEISADEGAYEKNFMEDQVLLPKGKGVKKYARHDYYAVNVEDGTIGDGVCLSKDNKAEKSPAPAFAENLGGKIPYWEEIVATVESMGKFIPQIEVMGIDVYITEDGFRFVDFSDHPYYPQIIGFNEEITEYLKMKVAQRYADAKNAKFKKKNLVSKANTFLWIRLAKMFCPPDMRPLIYKWWYVTVKADLLSKNGMSLAQKRWAYKKGFLSYRIPQYGITKDNYQNFISDYDYRYLRHINNKYRVWMEDKITVKYICSEYSQFFPKYYYHVSVRNGEKRIIPLMDLPDYCSNDLESIFELVKNEGALACKPQKGSQGQGFYKLSYHDGKYFLNHEEADREAILAILGNPDSQYLITEYIKQHHVINDIYAGAVNTLRIITFAKDGKNPVIGNAYMRFGSEKTGAVDNMGAGGMFVQVDMETGRFHNGKIITENSILPCKNHPDTNALLEGYLPNWDIIKKGVIDLCKAMPQLEYLGFDVAITEDGMKLPEINRAPGYPKIETFNRSTIDYLLYKKEMKLKSHNLEKTKW